MYNRNRNSSRFILQSSSFRRALGVTTRARGRGESKRHTLRNGIVRVARRFSRSGCSV